MLSKRLSLKSKALGFVACALLVNLGQNMTPPGAFAQAKNAEQKKVALLTDLPVGSKSNEDLMRRLAKSYEEHNAAAYLSLFKASVVQKLHLQIQFAQDCKSIARNFHLVTVAEEKARLSGHPKPVKSAEHKADKKADKNVDKNAVKPLPVGNYIDFELKEGPNASPVVVGVPVGQSKGLYYLMAL